jgi:ketosteroid isomerase-like protein
MHKILWIFAFVLFVNAVAYPQSVPAEKAVTNTNELVDQSLVARDVHALKLIYAEDFVFTHGTGTVDDKTSWLKAVANNNMRFVSRTHDSVQVELHDDIAIVSGKLSIKRMDDVKEVNYGLWYVRVFRFYQKENRWQLISHRTTKEWHY